MFKLMGKKIFKVYAQKICLSLHMGQPIMRIWYLSHMLLIIRKFSRGFYFCESSHMRSFTKIKPMRNGDITLPFTNVGESCSNHEF